MRRKAQENQVKIDPLYVIFEQHLYQFQEEASDRKGFLNAVVHEYLSYLRKNAVAVPKAWEQSIVEELEAQVNMMLLKKTYGHGSVEGFLSSDRDSDARNRASQNYRRLKNR